MATYLHNRRSNYKTYWESWAAASGDAGPRFQSSTVVKVTLPLINAHETESVLVSVASSSFWLRFTCYAARDSQSTLICLACRFVSWRPSSEARALYSHHPDKNSPSNAAHTHEYLAYGL
jgi:hypothetical protein